MAKTKAITALLNAQENNSVPRSFIRLETLDFNTKNGSRDRTVVLAKKRFPMERIVIAYRNVKYQNYDIKGVFVSTTEGTEIVSEALVKKGTAYGEPQLVESIEREITLNYDYVKLQKKLEKKNRKEEVELD